MPRENEKAIILFKKRAEKIEKDLLALAGDMFIHERIEGFGPINLEINLEPGSAQPGRKAVYRAIKKKAEELALKKSGFARDRVYCYKCNNFQCMHSKQPGPSSVFAGYHSSGTPQFHDFLQQLLDIEDDRAWLLYENKPPVLASFTKGYQVKKKQYFGRSSGVFNIWGQVCIGYFNRDRAALTVQVVETSHPDREKRIIVNRLFHVQPEELILQKENHYLYAALKRLENSIAHISTKKLGRREKIQAALGHLERFSRQVEKKHQLESKKTLHAKDRRTQKRPIKEALDDARKASARDYLYDPLKNTMIILGPRKRVHVFSTEGIHVTSLTLEKAAIDLRLRQNKWVPASNRIVKSFENALIAR